MVVALLLLLIVIGVPLIIVIGVYNHLVVFRNRGDNAWHQIDVQLQKRADLVPNLVETVKGYAAHEKQTFENVTKARAMYNQAGDIKQKAEATNMLTSALKTLFAVAENYPELKANQNFLLLQEELSGIESKIAYARQFYNDTILDYNNARQVFPSSIIANLFNFQAKDYFEIEEPAKREAPKVDFGK
ncbi:MAG: LemA family protein [candidate division Zixibacteria bacterium]|nr:LemA family protein [candidate division Zixibacteria bacterium]